MQTISKKTTSERFDLLNTKTRARAYHYLENLQQKNKSGHTIKSYENDLLQFFEWNESTTSKKLHQIDSEIISKYFEFLTNGGTIIGQV